MFLEVWPIRVRSYIRISMDPLTANQSLTQAIPSTGPRTSLPHLLPLQVPLTFSSSRTRAPAVQRLSLTNGSSTAPTLVHSLQKQQVIPSQSHCPRRHLSRIELQY